MTLDLSVVIPTHREGLLLHPTLRSIYRSLDHASQRGITAEVLIIADRPDETTMSYLDRIERPEVTTHSVAFADPARSRNYGVELARGQYVSFLDADDLVSENWLHAAVDSLARDATDVIVHPEYHIVFDAESMIWRQLSSTDPAVSLADQIEANHWTVVATARRALFQRFPYELTSPDSGFGFEDWHFNCETLAAGVEHRVLSGTVVFLRRKTTGSKLTRDRSMAIVPPTRFFEPSVFASMIKGR